MTEDVGVTIWVEVEKVVFVVVVVCLLWLRLLRWAVKEKSERRRM